MKTPEKRDDMDVAEKLEFTSIKKKENIVVKSGSVKQSILILGIIFLVALSSLMFVYRSLPQFDSEEIKAFKLPRSIDDAKLLGRVLSKYKESHFFPVVAGFFVTYVFLQSFAIPGSIFLSILSGFLFQFYLAIFLVCLASALGASFCYLLSNFFGKNLIWRLCPQRAAEWSDKVQKHSSNLLNYMIFLRITPLLPNWFINLVSPIINVPIFPFFLGTFLGVAPPSFVFIKAGTTLQEMSSKDSTISVASMVALGVLALVSILPVLFKSKLRQKFD